MDGTQGVRIPITISTVKPVEHGAIEPAPAEEMKSSTRAGGSGGQELGVATGWTCVVEVPVDGDGD